MGAKTVNKKKKKKNFAPRPRQLKIDEQLDYDSEWDENEDYEVNSTLILFKSALEAYLFQSYAVVRWKKFWTFIFIVTTNENF